MEIKPLIGYVVCQKLKTVSKARIVCPNDYENEWGLSGYGYIYPTKKLAKRDADALNEKWKDLPFIVQPAELRYNQ